MKPGRSVFVLQKPTHCVPTCPPLLITRLGVPSIAGRLLKVIETCVLWFTTWEGGTLQVTLI